MNLLMNYAMTAMSGSNLLSSVASFFASHKLLANLLILLDYTSFLQADLQRSSDLRDPREILTDLRFVDIRAL